MRVSSALEAGTVSQRCLVRVLSHNLRSGSINTMFCVITPHLAGKSKVELVKYHWVPVELYVEHITGRELGSYALHEYTEVKTVHWNWGDKLDWPL